MRAMQLDGIDAETARTPRRLHESITDALEADGIGWAYWELDYGFGFIRNRQSTEGFDRPVIEALLG